MLRYVPYILLCVMLHWASTGCAPKLLGPTTPSGYFYTLSVADSRLWFNAMRLAGNLPHNTEVIVRVQNAAGQLVDGVPVEFQVAPSWVDSVSITPEIALTKGGIARTRVQPLTSGALRLTTRVEDITQESIIVVQSYSPPQSR
jgi:hypothetical protein